MKKKCFSLTSNGISLPISCWFYCICPCFQVSRVFCLHPNTDNNSGRWMDQLCCSKHWKTVQQLHSATFSTLASSCLSNLQRGFSSIIWFYLYTLPWQLIQFWSYEENSLTSAAASGSLFKPSTFVNVI